MVQFNSLATAVAATAALAQLASAHPGEHHDHHAIRREIAERDAYGAHVARSLNKCARSANAQALQERAIARRAATAERLRQRAGLPARRTATASPAPNFLRRDEAALESWEQTSHNETGSYSSPYDASTLFGSNVSCALTPENVVGPYWVSGELIRSDVVETQTGVPVHLDMQFVDSSTCEPVASSSSLLVDLWHANATGVYSGVDGEGGLNTDFLRGVQQTDDDGVVAFDTVFPGHYQGRATHIHIMTHSGSTLLENDTYTGGTARHIGQLFFDEALRSAVEATEPYASNSQAVTSNDEDSLAPDSASTEYDPFPKYLYLGDSVSDGLLMWISIAVDMSADYTSDATAAAVWGEDGGYSTGNSGMGGGSGGAPGGSAGGPGGSAMPSGAMPSGSMSGAVPSGSAGTARPSGSGAPVSAASGASGASGAMAPSGSGVAPSGSASAIAGSGSNSVNTAGTNNNNNAVAATSSSAGTSTAGTYSGLIATFTGGATSLRSSISLNSNSGATFSSSGNVLRPSSLSSSSSSSKVAAATVVATTSQRQTTTAAGPRTTSANSSPLLGSRSSSASLSCSSSARAGGAAPGGSGGSGHAGSVSQGQQQGRSTAAAAAGNGRQTGTVNNSATQSVCFPGPAAGQQGQQNGQQGQQGQQQGQMGQNGQRPSSGFVTLPSGQFSGSCGSVSSTQALTTSSTRRR